MITRIFRVRVPEHLHHEFEMKFSTISVNAVKSQHGLISVAAGSQALFGNPMAWKLRLPGRLEAELSRTAFPSSAWEPFLSQALLLGFSPCTDHID